MKTNKMMKIIVAAALLTGAALMLQAQNAAPTCPLGNTPGYGRSLTPEQRAAHRADMEKLKLELRAKQANNALTAEEQAVLQRLEQCGGPCVGGQNGGRGKGPKDGTGNQWRRGQGRGCVQGCPQASVISANNEGKDLVAQCDGSKSKGQGPKDGTGTQKGKGKGKAANALA